MRVVHIAGSVSRRAGGLFNSVRRLAQEELILGCDVKVLGGVDEFTKKDIYEWAPLRPRTYTVCGPASLGISREISLALTEWKPDIVHLHGLWQYPSYAVSKWARSNGIPYVVSPRGMLDQWALKNSAWKKMLAGALYEKRSLSSAGCLHALTEKEVEDIRKYEVETPVCVLPNGVDVQEEGSESKEQGSDIRCQVSRDGKRSRILLYIGRLHPKKGLENMLRAWSLVNERVEVARTWRLVVAGWDDGGHEINLRKLTADLGVEDSVEFSGSVYGADKDAILKRADAFILPSRSEGLPMSVLEAWAFGLPVVMTRECNLPEGFDAGAAIEVAADLDSVAAGLCRLLDLSDEDRSRMGAKGRYLVAQKYAWRSIAEKMLGVYRWIIDGGSSPDCVK